MQVEHNQQNCLPMANISWLTKVSQTKTKTKHFRSLYHSAVPFRKCNCNDQVPHCVRIETFASQGLLHTHARRAYTSSMGGYNERRARLTWRTRKCEIPMLGAENPKSASATAPASKERPLLLRRGFATWSKSVREKEHQKESGECTCVCKDDSFNTRTELCVPPRTEHTNHCLKPFQLSLLHTCRL